MFDALGLLECSTYSYVTVEGNETGRFCIPGMKSGLSMSSRGHDCQEILISDSRTRCVYVVKDNQLTRTLRHETFLVVSNL